MYQWVAHPGESETAIHREIRQRHRVSVDGNRSRPPWYEAPNSRQAAAGRPDPTQELVRTCWMSAGGIGGVGGRREKTTALADECDSRCGACAATLTDEELEGGTGGTGSLSAHTGGPISSHSRASLCTRFAICLAQKSTPRRSRNPSRRRVLGSAAPYGTPRIGAVVDQLALPNRVAPRVDRGDWCGARGFRPPCRGLWSRQDPMVRVIYPQVSV